MKTSTVVSKDNVAKILDAGARRRRGACCGSRPPGCRARFLHPGRRIKLHPGRLVRLRRQPRRHRRALVRQHHRSGQRRPRAGRRAELLLVRRASGSLLRDAVAEAGAAADRQGDVRTSTSAGRSTRSSSTTWGRSRTTCTRASSRPSSSARKASPRATTSRRSTTTSATTSPTRSWASSPARPRPRSASAWRTGTRATTASSISRRPTACKPGTGWLIPPGVLHAPGSLCTYEPQWGSDVFGMYQSIVEGRDVPWSLLVKDMPKEKHQDLDFIVEPARLGEERRPALQGHNYLEPIVDKTRSGQGYIDKWIVYGTVDGEQLFSAKELTVEPGAKCTHQGPRRQRLDHRARQRPHRQAAPANARHDPLRPGDRGRSLHHRTKPPRAASRSRTPAASRWSACATSARTCTRSCRTWATTRRSRRSTSTSSADNPITTRNRSTHPCPTPIPNCTTPCGPASSARSRAPTIRRSASTACSS